MSTNTSSSTDSQTSSGVVNRVKFSVFLSLQIPSVLCSLYLFAQYVIRANLRRSIHYHILIVLLCSSLVFVVIPLSASEAFFYTSTVRPASNLFCSMWIWIHYSINIGNLMLTLKKKSVVYKTKKSFKHLQRLTNPRNRFSNDRNLVMYSRCYA